MKISVIVPVYNTEEFLPPLLESLEGQTFKDFEAIFVVDGSPDNSLELLNNYKAKSPLNIKVIVQENKGLPGARNTGLEIAVGEFITFIDSDDNITPYCLEALLRGIDYGRLDFSCIMYKKTKKVVRCEKMKKKMPLGIKLHTLENCRGYGSFIDFLHSSPRSKKLKYFILPNFAWGRLYKRELIGSIRFEEDLTGAEDMPFNAQYFAVAKTAGFVPLCCYYYLQRKGSILHQKSDDKVNRNLLAALRASNIAKELESDDESRAALSTYSFIDKATLFTLLNKKKFPDTANSYKDFLRENYPIFKSHRPKKWYHCFISLLYKLYCPR